MNAFNWTINLIPNLAGLWTWLTEPLFVIGELEVAPIGLISTTALATLLGLALIRGR